MRKIRLGYRKIKLQYKVVKYLRKSENKVRYNEQRKAFRLLFNPRVLFKENSIEYENSKYDYVTTKTFNVLTSNCINDKLYQITSKKYK